jgi:hypothetical protein
MRSAIKTGGLEFLLGALFVGYCAFAQTSAPKSLAAQCAPDLERVQERIFANPGGKGWHEYGSLKQLRQMSGHNGEQMMAVKTSASGQHFVRTVEYGDDSARFQGDCYDGNGQLRSLHYEMRTGRGWGYEDVRSFDGRGKLLRHATRFFDTRTQNKIDRPSEAKDMPNVLRPAVRNQFESLPIAGILKQNATAK